MPPEVILKPSALAKLGWIARVWGGALTLSALVVWAGHRWSQPLLEQDWARQHPGAPLLLLVALLALPPAGMALVLLRGLGAANHDRGESFD